MEVRNWIDSIPAIPTTLKVRLLFFIFPICIRAVMRHLRRNVAGFLVAGGTTAPPLLLNQVKPEKITIMKRLARIPRKDKEFVSIDRSKSMQGNARTLSDIAFAIMEYQTVWCLTASKKEGDLALAVVKRLASRAETIHEIMADQISTVMADLSKPI